MLNDIENTQIGKHIVSWVSNTGGFKIYDVKMFASEILPIYFANIQYKSFIRQINIYGFRRVRRDEEGTIVGAYVHPLFVRNQPDLCWQMRRTKVKGPGMFLRTIRAHNQISQYNNAIAFFGAQNRVTIDEPPQHKEVQSVTTTSTTVSVSSNEQYDPCCTPSKEEETCGKFDGHDVMNVQPYNGILTVQQIALHNKKNDPQVALFNHHSMNETTPLYHHHMNETDSRKPVSPFSDDYCMYNNQAMKSQ